MLTAVALAVVLATGTAVTVTMDFEMAVALAIASDVGLEGMVSTIRGPLDYPFDLPTF